MVRAAVLARVQRERTGQGVQSVMLKVNITRGCRAGRA